MLTAFLSHANWLAIAVAAVTYFMLGAIWYSPILFSKIWAEGHGIVVDESEKKRMPLIFGTTLIIALVMSASIALLTFGLESTRCVSGIKVGLLCGVGLAIGPMGMNFLYHRKTLKLFLIDAGYHIIGCVLAGIIVSIWH
ncbi:MAG: hypothetical protein Fur0041_02930 [Bacteroidia bacterium]